MPADPAVNGAPLPEPADFLRDTRVEPGGEPGLYQASLEADWNAALHPFGGLVAALALRAMQAELGRPEHRLRTATTVFVSPVAVGPVEIRVERLRIGGRMSQLAASVRNAGDREAGHRTLAVFGEGREGFEFTDVRPPEAPSPERCPPPAEPPPTYQGWRGRFFEQFDIRRVRHHAPWETGWAGGRAESIRWMRYRRPPRLPDGRLEPLALVPLTDTMPPAIGQRLGPNHPFFLAPSCDLTVHLLGTTRSDWLLVRSRCSHAGEGYASGTAQIWEPGGRLLAHATQLMYIRLGVSAGSRPRP